MAIPIVAIPGASHDDAHFTNLANYIQNGQWLGPYDHMTLAKGAGYPIFLAVVDHLNIPVKAAEHALYLMAATAASGLVGYFYRSRWAAVFIFLCLALNPALWSHGAQRITRESFYAGLCLAIFAGAAWFLTAAAWKTAAPIRWLAGIVLGLLVGFFFVTREEGIWIVPSLLVFALGAYMAHAQAGAREGSKPSPRPLQLAGILALFLSFASLTPIAISVANEKTYGTRLLNDIKAGAYPAAYGAIVSISPNGRDPRLGFTEETVRLVKEVSPDASILLSNLSFEENAGWRRVTCDELKLSPCPRAIGSAWVLWALRQAANNEGKFKSAEEAQAYFLKVSTDLRSACESGRVRCGKLQESLAPPPQLEYAPRVMQGFLEGLNILRTLGAPNINWLHYPSSTSEEIRFSRISGPISSPDKPVKGLLIEGWIASPSLKSLEISGWPGSAIASEEAPDVARHLKAEEGSNVVARRLSIVANCGTDTCSLAVVDADGTRNVFNVKDLTIESNRIRDAILFVSDLEPAERVNKRINLHSFNKFADDLESVANRIAWGFVLASVLLLYEAPRAVFSMIFGRVKQSADYILVACVLAVFVRLGLLSYINATSFNAVTPQYLLPCIPLYLLAVALAVISVVSRAKRAMQACNLAGRS